MKAPEDQEPRTQGAQGHGWRTLLEFTLDNGSGSEHRAAGRVVQAVQALVLGDQTLAELRHALARAVRYTVQGDEPASAGHTLVVRVLIPAGLATASTTGEAAWLATNQVSGPKSSGWGFFLVHKRAEHPHNPVGEPYDVIELYLYQEG